MAEDLTTLDSKDYKCPNQYRGEKKHITPLEKAVGFIYFNMI